MKTKKLFRKKILSFIWGIGFVILGCSGAQVAYGQYWLYGFDGASTLKPAQIELMPYGVISIDSKYEETEVIGGLTGLRAGIGIIKGLDVRLTYGRAIYSEDSGLKDLNENVFGIVPKVSILEGRLSFAVPFQMIFTKWDQGEGTSNKDITYIVGPRITVSYQVKNFMEVNVSPEFDFFFPGNENDPKNMLGGNIGFAFSNNLEKWSVRPEAFVKYLFPSGGKSMDLLMYGGGIAFTFNLDLFRKK